MSIMKPKKPKNLKIISGTIQKCRENRSSLEPTLIQEVPSPPDWLPNTHAVKEWNRLAPILIANKLLTDLGLSAFAVMCALHGKIIQLFGAGEMPTGHMLAQYRNLANDFGLTPVSQEKIQPVGLNRPKNPFLKHIKE